MTLRLMLAPAWTGVRKMVVFARVVNPAIGLNGHGMRKGKGGRKVVASLRNQFCVSLQERTGYTIEGVKEHQKKENIE